MPTPDISPSSPNTADSPIRRALLAGIRKLQSPHKSVVRATETEEKVRAGELHAARNLDLIVQRGRLNDVPLYGPHGLLQLADRLRFAIRLLYGACADVRDVHAASLAETLRQAQVDLHQVQKIDLMNFGQLEDFAALCEAQRDALADLALALRCRAHSLACATVRRAMA